MKLDHVSIQNFKGLRELEFPGAAAPEALRGITALLGDNGSGKTTALQAIALTLSLATRRTQSPASFNWHGFMPERLSSLGPTVVELEVEFEPEEITLTQELFEAWRESLPSDRRQAMRIVPPSDRPKVTLRLENGRVTSPQGFGAELQFLGRYYVKQLHRARPDLRGHFSRLGDVFWFDQYRNLGAIQGEETRSDGRPDGGGGPLPVEAWRAGVEQLREYLVGQWAFHTSPGRRGKDYIPLLEAAFNRVFPGTKFVGVRPMADVGQGRSDFYFLIDRDDREYDIAEMSSGEQAVFPLLYEFVRLDIGRSVVLIDELELHLHPPEQQRLLGALPRLGPDCQFLITTHSEYLTSVIPDEQEIRLERGIGCL